MSSSTRTLRCGRLSQRTAQFPDALAERDGPPGDERDVMKLATRWRCVNLASGRGRFFNVGCHSVVCCCVLFVLFNALLCAVTCAAVSCGRAVWPMYNSGSQVLHKVSPAAHPVMGSAMGTVISRHRRRRAMQGAEGGSLDIRDMRQPFP